MDVIGEVLVAILAGIVELFIWLLTIILSQSWLAMHRDGMRRWGHILAISMAVYLLFGLIRPFVPVLWTPALTPIYQWPIILLAIVLLLVGVSIGESVRRTSATPEDAAAETDSATKKGFIAAIVALVAVIGIGSAFFSERHEATLAEKLCARADARISDELENTVRDGAGLLDRVLGTQTADRIPCADD